MTTDQGPAPAKPQRCILYGRISDDRPDEDNGGKKKGEGVKDQEADLRRYARRLGWKVGRVIIENDTSAFKRKTVTLPNGERAMRVDRKGWRSLLDDLAAGKADGLLAVTCDRVARDPRDLEDLIDVVEEKHIPVESVSGSLKLATDADITMARMMCAVANKSSRDTSAPGEPRPAPSGRGGAFRGRGSPLRPQFERHRSSQRGQGDHRGGPRAVLSGVGVVGVVKDLNARAVPTIRAKRWTHSSLRDILLQPRIAGLMSFGGVVLEGDKSCWEPIVSRSTWEALRVLLTKSQRRTTRRRPGRSTYFPIWPAAGTPPIPKTTGHHWCMGGRAAARGGSRRTGASSGSATSAAPVAR